MAEDERFRRFTRLLQLQTIKRVTVISQIRALHATALRVQSESDLAPEFVLNAADLDSLWSDCRSFDLAVLNCLFQLNRTDEYLHDLYSSMLDYVEVSKTVLAQIRLGSEFTAPSNIISKAHPTTSESVSSASSTIVPGGRFSEVLLFRPSRSFSVVPF